MARRCGLGARLTVASEVESALEGASYVITSIRVGGIDARVKDETIALAHGLVGQETVGAGGFACAMRNLTFSWLIDGSTDPFDLQESDYERLSKPHLPVCG